MSILLLQAVKCEKIKDMLILAVMLLGIPVVTLGFIEYAGITVWAFPAVLMFASLVFNTRVPLILISVMSIAAQLLVWINVPVKSVRVDEFDFISVSQLNFNGNINAVLKKTGLFLKVDRTYIFLLNDQDSTMNYVCEWCKEGVARERETIRQVPLETFPWGMEQ